MIIASNYTSSIIISPVINPVSVLITLWTPVLNLNTCNNHYLCSTFLYSYLMRLFFYLVDLATENYQKKAFSNTAMMEETGFQQIYFNWCKKYILPDILCNKNYELHDNLPNLIRKWDNSGIPLAIIYVTGCFAWLSPEVHAGLFIQKSAGVRPVFPNRSQLVGHNCWRTTVLLFRKKYIYCFQKITGGSPTQSTTPWETWRLGC